MSALRQIVFPSLLLLVLHAAVSAQAAEADAPRPLQQREKVLVGSAGRQTAVAALHLAMALGEFEKENLSVELSIHRPSDNFVLLATGRIDVAVGQPSAAFFNAVAAGAGIKQVAPTGTFAPKNGFWVSQAWLKGRPWSPEMLKGQVIAAPAGLGTTTAHAARVELAKAGLTLNDISWRAMSLGDLLPALENGSVNIALLLDPFWRNADPAKVTYVFSYGYPPGVPGGYFFGPNLLVQKRAVGEAFVRALARTTRLYLQGDFGKDPRVAAALAKELQVSLEQVTSAADSLIFPADLPIRGDLAAMLQDTYFSTPGILTYSQPMPEDKVVDRGFVRAAGISPPTTTSVR